MRSFLRDATWVVLLLCGFTISCESDGNGGGGTEFVGLWRYQTGSFSFVNCFSDSRSVELTGTGFQIVEESGGLVRISTDGCRFALVPSTSRHADGIAGEECTVQVADPSGNPITAHYRLSSLRAELKPDDASQMVEIFELDAETTTNLGTIQCQISGSNTLDRVP